MDVQQRTAQYGLGGITPAQKLKMAAWILLQSLTGGLPTELLASLSQAAYGSKAYSNQIAHRFMGAIRYPNCAPLRDEALPDCLHPDVCLDAIARLAWDQRRSDDHSHDQRRIIAADDPLGPAS
jgi:hypothetical protein